MCDSIFSKAEIKTPIGSMIALSDENVLYLLHFVDKPGLDKEIGSLCKKTGFRIASGNTKVLSLLEKELKLYFEGKLKKFSVPYRLVGTEFQIQTRIAPYTLVGGFIGS